MTGIACMDRGTVLLRCLGNSVLFVVDYSMNAKQQICLFEFRTGNFYKEIGHMYMADGICQRQVFKQPYRSRYRNMGRVNNTINLQRPRCKLHRPGHFQHKNRPRSVVRQTYNRHCEEMCSNQRPAGSLVVEVSSKVWPDRAMLPHLQAIVAPTVAPRTEKSGR